VTAVEDNAGAASQLKAVPVRHPGRWVAAIIIAVLAAMLVHSLVTNPLYDWGRIGRTLFAGPILRGALKTLEITVLAMLVGVLGGILLAVMRLSANPVLSSTSAFYIWFFRGTPVLVQVVIWYNLNYLYKHISLGLPFVHVTFVTFSTNSLITQFGAAILGLGLNEAAYMAEIVRAGILSVDEGQTEAAAALGMPGSLILRRIVLPQAMRIIVPPTGNETISMLKTTSILIYIALPELFTSAQNYINATYVSIPYFIVACIWYLAMTSVLTVGQGYIERYYGRGASRNVATGGFLERMRQALRFGRPWVPGRDAATTPMKQP
jgi:polar amino acid transport system permease protein